MFSKRMLIFIRNYQSKVPQRLKEAGIVPDLLKTAPNQACKVVYPSGVTVEMGNELKPKQVKEPPEVTWNADTRIFYTLCMVDPDAPSRQKPEYRSWQHWIIGNIPGEMLFRGKVIAQYIGAGPPKDSGLHRYVFLVYKQQGGKLEFKEPVLSQISAIRRGAFCVTSFAANHHLGDPIAANYFLAQWDDYVPILHKQLHFQE